VLIITGLLKLFFNNQSFLKLLLGGFLIRSFFSSIDFFTIYLTRYYGSYNDETKVKLRKARDGYIQNITKLEKFIKENPDSLKKLDEDSKRKLARIIYAKDQLIEIDLN
jgi:hypothetical protein